MQVLFAVVLCGLPIAAGLAILRHRLYEIDRVVNRTLVYGALSAAIVGLYATVVLTVDALLADADSRGGALVATGVVAVTVHPLRTWLQQRVNRLMYGDRDDPYAALSRLGERLGADVAPDAVLTTIVGTVAEALRVPYVAIELAHDARLQPPRRTASAAAASSSASRSSHAATRSRGSSSKAALRANRCAQTSCACSPTSGAKPRRPSTRRG